MNIDPSGLENSDQRSIWRDDLAPNLGPVRSYRCTFCKRGFSNAQALGGHMNIHRKDRAKLKEFSHENLLSLDITKNTDCGDSYRPANSSACQKLRSESETRKEGSDGKVEDLYEGNLDIFPSFKENSIRRRLPLFAEAPSVSGEHEGPAGNSRFDKHLENRKMELILGDVDLELRLGPEPHHAKTRPIV
ncbi:hypothetical protein Pfo_004378 [Paulownia fortunei]|nr:hypothetical protein Pfo_004378 [Paulownia fortunei]